MQNTPLPAAGGMREEDWTSLVSSIEQGNCILMVGPDAVMGTFGGKRRPLSVGLAHFVKDKLGPDYVSLNASEPSAVAQVAIFKEDPFTLQGWVQEFYDQVRDESSVMADLAAMPFRLVVNTSPLPSVGRAFSAIKPDTNVDFYDRTAPVRRGFSDPSGEAPFVYNLYGSLDHPASLILSDSDRLDFLVSVISDNPPLPAKLRSALRDPSRSFLFLGFRLHHWQLRVLLHVLAQDARRRFKSFALELEQAELSAETRLFYETGHKIHFYDMDVEDFAGELRRRVRLPATTSDASADAGLLLGAPIVFISHANEDRDFAARLAFGLRQEGINTWLDKEEIRGGDSWDSLIRKTIDSEVQYVVVIQSASLKEKEIGYVNKEIELALERQLMYRKPRRFLIPVVIDGPGSLLPELAHLQSIDLSHNGGIDDLVKAIYRDLNLADRQH